MLALSVFVLLAFAIGSIAKDLNWPERLWNWLKDA